MAVTLIQTLTSNGSTAVFDFTSIPNTFTDIMLVISARQATGTNAIGRLTFNGVTTNLSSRVLAGGGSSAVSVTGTQIEPVLSYATDTANTFGNISIYIPNYASTTTAKSVSVDSVSENNATAAYQRITAGLWNSTAAINQISFTSPDGFWSTGSTASLYGVTKWVQPAAKATGGTMVYSGGYWYHTFTASGTFTPTAAMSADVLVVAGGGGGGRGVGGGGGAGGLLGFANQSLTATGYSIVVGSGGAGNATTYGGNGANSTFGALTAAVGGGGGGTNNLGSAEEYGRAGGSGGGSYSGRAGGAGTAGQGNAGGSPSNVGYGGGGGGAGAAGTGGGGGGGGVGVNTYSSWATATGTGDQGYFAGGGAGGYGGVGGLGGGGGNSDGMPNTGGGGYGGKTGNGYNGGSGIVIVRYAA